MERISVRVKKVKMKEVVELAFDPKRVEDYCKTCPNYGMRWSCPPHSFEPLTVLKKYEELFIIGTTLFYREEEKQRYRGRETVFQYTQKRLHSLRKRMYPEFLKLEEKKEVLVLDMGSCILCETCSRGSGYPCKRHSEMRYSLEALGFDVVTLMKKYFQIELKWAGGTLPPYHVLVSAIATKEGEDLEELKTLESKFVEMSFDQNYESHSVECR